MLDDLDYRVIWYLDNNAKLPLAELARLVGISRQTLNYRLHKLIEEKVLLGFIAAVDIHRLGFLTYRVYVRYKPTDRDRAKEITEHLKAHSNTLWLVDTEGPWDMEVVFTARNFIHFNNLFKTFNAQYGKYFAKYNISMSPVSYHFKRDYLISAKRAQFAPTYYGFEPQAGTWNDTDLRILAQLSKDCRKTNEEIAEAVGVTAQTVKQRTRQLEENKVIPSYRILLDLEKIGRHYVKVMLYFVAMSERDEKRIYNFCAERNYVIYLTEVLGEWQVELEMEIENRDQIAELLRDLGKSFPDKIVRHEILEVTKEHKMNYFPMGDELAKVSVKRK